MLRLHPQSQRFHREQELRGRSCPFRSIHCRSIYRRRTLALLVALWLNLLCVTSVLAQNPNLTTSASTSARPPNLVLLFADDLGYADLHCFGGEQMVTPNLDQLAAGGMRLTSFYASQAVCSASRCSLMTGCYNVRVSILGALGPGAKTCLNPEEQTIAEVLRDAGYRTAAFGKWHLGDRGQGLPSHHGFDEYHGLPYSNDMWPFHPTSTSFPKLPLIENDRIVDESLTAEEQPYLTQWATEHAIDFIRRNRESPFFVYVPYSMPHVPIYASPAYKDATGQGLFTDVIAEIDGSVGQIVATLKDLQLDENTLVLFTSDNGPWLSYGNHAGSAAPLREGKGTTWEGGQREPTIAYWPGKIPAGSTCDAAMGTIDVLPTFTKLAGGTLPAKKIDGVDVWPWLSGEKNDESPHQAYYYYWNNELHAIRSGKWKLHFPHDYRSLSGEPGRDGKPAAYVQKKCGLELYDLDADIGEQVNVAEQNSQIVAQLQELAEVMRSELGDQLNGIPGSAIRPAGKLE